MISNNPINRILFLNGYLGRINIYEYWTEHKTDLIKYMQANAPTLLEDRCVLESFEAMVRWRSPIGALLVEEIRNVFRKSVAGTTITLNNMRVAYGKKNYTLKQFNEMYPCGHSNSSHSNIRGISLIKSDLYQVTLSNIDMTYVSFNRSHFESCSFNNCSLDYARFDGVEFNKVSFDGRCSLSQVSFIDAYIDATFDTPIDQPQLSSLKRKHIFDILIDNESLWKTYSEILGDSFAANCHSTPLSTYISQLQYTLENVRLAASYGPITKLKALFFSEINFPK